MITILKHPRLSIFIALVFCLPLTAAAQRVLPQDAQAVEPATPRPNLLRELGLSFEQIQSVRKLNADRKPVEMQARRRFQAASRELNKAIYADTAGDEVFEARLKEFQSAQAEIARIKFTSELAVRRLLTPEQLERFRGLRNRFADARENMEKGEGRPLGRPALRRLRRANRQFPLN